MYLMCRTAALKRRTERKRKREEQEAAQKKADEDKKPADAKAATEKVEAEEKAATAAADGGAGKREGDGSKGDEKSTMAVRSLENIHHKTPFIAQTLASSLITIR